MAASARIDAFTVTVNLNFLDLGEFVTIGRSNWISGVASGTSSPHFAHQPERRAELDLGSHAAITKHHHIDCINHITIGPSTTIAAYHSQLLRHAIDLHAAALPSHRQR
jgi:hypothetical protein